MVVAEDNKQSSSGLEFKLHPLVLINISDHFTRLRANAPDGAPPPAVLGLLLGSQDGRCVDVCNSFELKATLLPPGSAAEAAAAAAAGGADGGAAAAAAAAAGGVWQIDEAFLLKKQEQYKTVFPKQDVVGWYCTGQQLGPQHMAVHRRVMELNEGPVFLQLDPLIEPGAKDLPVEVYETELHVLDGMPQTIFVRANFSMETSDAERIGVDQVAKILPSGKATGSEQLTAHLSSLHAAIKMLVSKLEVVQGHLDDVAAGNVAEFPHELVRQVNSLVGSLPALDNPAFRKEYLVEFNDTLATLLLSGVTQSLTSLAELTDKLGVAFERPGGRRGGRGGGLMNPGSMFGL